MDRRSFLQSMAAIGLLPAGEVERLLQAPEVAVPSAAELLVDGITLHPLSITMRHDLIDVTSWNDHNRHYIRGTVSFDLDLTEDDYRSLGGRFGKEVALRLALPGGQGSVDCGRAALSSHGYSDIGWAGGRRCYATFIAL